jgi:uncharacterized membrane protein HdeD (DUF308 family)
MKSLGVVLIILGVLALAYQGFSYTKREKVIDVGPIEASADKKEHVAIPPIVGAIVLVAGVVMVVASRKSS